LFILHVIEKYKIKLDCTIFVSPLLDEPEGLPMSYKVVNKTFYKTDFDYEKLKKCIPVSYVLYSDTDPYIEPHRALHFAKVLDSSVIMVRRAGHMNSEVNMNEFPLVYDLCVTRLDLTLYQKYAYKREAESAVERLKVEDKKYYSLTADQLEDEGTFHFMNLAKGGFATFPTNSEEWDPEGVYYEGGRKNAGKGLDITRVFVVMNPKDLERKTLHKQIELDIQGKIKVYLIDYNEFKKIGSELDFGVWDNEYICIMNRDKEGNILGGAIDARVKSLLTAQNWRDRIIRMSTRVENLDDVRNFMKS